MQRLAEPHVHFNLAHEAFSRFISKYAESTYETSMVEAREVYSKPKAAAEVRIPEEDKLEKAKFSAPAYKRYLAWEQEVKKPDTALVRVLYERALKRCYYDVELWQDFLAFLVGDKWLQRSESGQTLRKIAYAAIGISTQEYLCLTCLCHRSNRHPRRVPKSCQKLSGFRSIGSIGHQNFGM